MEQEQHWQDWDGAGHEDAVAWSPGIWEDPKDAAKGLRMLGVEIPRSAEVGILVGHVGTVGGIAGSLHACDPLGRCLEQEPWSVHECQVDPGSITWATFVFISET
jgi:broad specificity phosphatase PhoE